MSKEDKFSLISFLKSKHILRDMLYIFLGALVQALAMRLFLIPGLMVSGGISGAAQIINYFSGWPIGLMVFVGNLPLYLIGWRYLGGARFALRTVAAILFFSVLTDSLAFFLPTSGITGDLVLNCLYGGLTLGVGLGLVYRGRGTSGGSDILGRILNHYKGMSISQAYLITDAAVVLASGFAFGWERALYGLIVIYVSGMAAELVSEGMSVFRITFIVTNKPDKIVRKITRELERGVTVLAATGGHTGKPRTVLYCVLTRAEVIMLRSIVSEIDPEAFMSVGQATEALGEGFKPLRRS